MIYLILINGKNYVITEYLLITIHENYYLQNVTFSIIRYPSLLELLRLNVNKLEK